MLDWTGTNSNIRYYGTNAHHDTVWTASSTGTVSATLRYDPWGVLTSSTGTSLPDFRFQGSWFDTTASLSWVITRWYAPTLGRFISEDTLMGTAIDPPSRHLYAYGAGEPIGRWDPLGQRSGYNREELMKWVRWHQNPHDSVVQEAAAEVRQRWPRGTTYAALKFTAPPGYRIPGGGLNGGDGLPDVAWKFGKQMKLWEVKYQSDRGAAEGRSQIRRYIAALKKANQGITATAGNNLHSGGPIPIVGMPGLTVSWRSDGDGVVVYWTSWRPERPPYWVALERRSSQSSSNSNSDSGSGNARPLSLVPNGPAIDWRPTIAAAVEVSVAYAGYRFSIGRAGGGKHG
jgi:RHS repeat-associated protein